MSTMLKAELSRSNEFWVPKERRLELVHFVRQMPYWIQEYNSYDISSINTHDTKVQTSDIFDRTAQSAIKKAGYSRKIKMVNTSAQKAISAVCKYMNEKSACDLCDILINAIISDETYDSLDARFICSRDTYYRVYRAFFFFLDKERD